MSKNERERLVTWGFVLGLVAGSTLGVVMGYQFGWGACFDAGFNA